MIVVALIDNARDELAAVAALAVVLALVIVANIDR